MGELTMGELEEMSKSFQALGPMLGRRRRRELQDDSEKCELFEGETCTDVRRLVMNRNSLSCRCLSELADDLPQDTGLTPAMREMTFEGYSVKTDSQAEALATCRAYVAEHETPGLQRPWVVLHGPPGVGKTHLAVAVMQKVAGSFFVSWPYVLDELRPGRSSDISPEHIWDTLYRPGLLVIDDFGKDSDSDWAQRQLYQVADRRSWLRLPTIWTANLMIGQSVGPVGSRLRDSQVSRVIRVTGPDHRIEGGD